MQFVELRFRINLDETHWTIKSYINGQFHDTIKSLFKYKPNANGKITFNYYHIPRVLGDIKVIMKDGNFSHIKIDPISKDILLRITIDDHKKQQYNRYVFRILPSKESRILQPDHTHTIYESEVLPEFILEQIEDFNELAELPIVNEYA